MATMLGFQLIVYNIIVCKFDKDITPVGDAGRGEPPEVKSSRMGAHRLEL